jgi:hypothetical protein
VTGHVYDPSPSGWCGICQEHADYCTGRPAPNGSAPVVQLRDPGEPPPAAASNGQARPQVIRLADVEPERVEWLWPGYLPLGKVVVIDGDPGVGKSTVCLDVAARVSTGSPMPDGSPAARGAVLVLSAEDGLADTIRPRLDAAQADAGQVITITQIGAGQDARPVSIPGDLPASRPSSRSTRSGSSSSTCSWPTSPGTSTPTVTRTSAAPSMCCPRSRSAAAAAS